MKLRTPAAILVTGASWGLGCQEYNPALLPGALTVTPEALDFGSMPTGERPVLTLQLANPGEAPVGVLGVSAEDPFWVDPYEAELEGGRVVSLEVGFVAVEIGEFAGVVEVLSSDPDNASVLVPAIAQVTQPTIQVSPTSLEFPVQPEASFAAFSIASTGQGSLQVSQVELSDDAGGVFSLVGSDGPFTIGQDESVEVEVQCQALELAEGALTVHSDDLDRPQVEVTLTTLDVWASITSPGEGDRLAEGAQLLEGLVGSVGDPALAEARWRSSIDGDLGLAEIPEDGAVSSTAELSHGSHELTLQVDASWGSEATDQVTVLVDGSPTAEITWPSDGYWSFEGLAVRLNGKTTDPADDSGDLQVVWASDVDGELYSGSAPDDGLPSHYALGLSDGEHSITLTVTDPWGNSASDQVDIDIVDCDDTVDSDGDGYSPREGDCDDTDADVHPGVSADVGDQDSACHGGGVVEIQGIFKNDDFGYSFGDPGDFDGDGLNDFLIGARDYPADAWDGGIWMVFGRDAGWSTEIPAATLVAITGDSTAQRFAQNVTGVEDLDGDGLDEVAAFSAHGDGYTYVFMGRSSWSSMSYSAADVELVGPAGSEVAGEDISSGDFDGDGYGDLAIGSAKHDSEDGRAWVVLGSGATYGVSSLDSAPIQLAPAESGARFGNAIASAGDVDGDGADDLLVAAEESDLTEIDGGAVHLYTQLDGLAGLVVGGAWASWLGEAGGDELGTHDMIASAGDMDGDGVPDLLFVAAGYDTTSLTDAGKIYLASGAQIEPGEQAAADIAWSWVGDGGGDLFGSTGEGLAPAGDVDGDGRLDFLVGADEEDYPYTEAGRAYVFLGRERESWSQERPLSSADRMLHGLSAGAHTGRALYGVGDVDSNGVDDFVVGAYGDGAGKAYLYLNDYGWCPE